MGRVRGAPFRLPSDTFTFIALVRRQRCGPVEIAAARVSLALSSVFAGMEARASSVSCLRTTLVIFTLPSSKLRATRKAKAASNLSVI